MCRRKTDINPIFNSHAIFKFNGVHINEIKDKHCILLIISSFQVQDRNRRARGISTGKISLSYYF